MVMSVEQSVEGLAGDIEALGQKLPQRHFFPTRNPTWPEPTSNLGRRRGGKPGTNRLS
jgi:hypothetical protein